MPPARPDRARRPAAGDAALVPRLRDERHRRARAARRPRRPQAGAPPGAVRDVRRRLPARTAATPSAPASSATSWATTTRTATPRSTTPWCGWRSRGRCATRWSTARATSARRATTRPRPCATPSAGWRRWPWRWSATSTRTPSTSRRTTTAGRRSRRSCRAASRTCWSTARPASRSAWRRTSRRTTCARSPRASSGCWRTRRPTTRSCSTRSAADQGPGLPDRRARSWAARDRGRLPHRSRLDHDARGRRGRGDPEPDLPGGHRAALPGQPGQPAGQDRRPGRRRPGRRHRRRPRRDLGQDRPAARHRAQARRGRQGRAEQPLQAHPAAGHLRREHARAGRRRAAHAVPRRVRPALGRPPDRRHRPAHPLPAAQGRARRTSSAGYSRRWTRSTRSSR